MEECTSAWGGGGGQVERERERRMHMWEREGEKEHMHAWEREGESPFGSSFYMFVFFFFPLGLPYANGLRQERCST